MSESAELKRSPSGRSLRGLDGLNFLIADVRDGLGPTCRCSSRATNIGKRDRSGQFIRYHWIFYLVCAFALASAAAVTLINWLEINHEAAMAARKPRPLVISVILASDVARGTGSVALAVRMSGYPAGFLSLVALAVGALAFFAAFMAETADPKRGDTAPTVPRAHPAPA